MQITHARTHKSDPHATHTSASSSYIKAIFTPMLHIIHKSMQMRYCTQRRAHTRSVFLAEDTLLQCVRDNKPHIHTHSVATHTHTHSHTCSSLSLLPHTSDSSLDQHKFRSHKRCHTQKPRFDSNSNFQYIDAESRYTATRNCNRFNLDLGYPVRFVVELVIAYRLANYKRRSAKNNNQ